jgi:uncharacterized membrane protein
MTTTELDATQVDAFGPIDFLVLEFPADRMTGEAAAALLDLVERGIIRIYDLLVVRKDQDGTISGIDITDLSADELGGFVAFSGARSGLIGDDDISEAGQAMEPGTAAALLVYENAWAAPFVAAARRSGAEVIASARIPASVVMDALDELEAADAS